MKSVQIGAALAALIGANALATTADADPFYAKVSLGQTINTEVSGLSLSDGDAMGVALGTSVGPVRVEGGVSRLSGDFAGVVETDALDYHVTGYLDLPVGDNASVFAGAGLDYIDGEAGIYGSSIEASGQGWHWAVGGAYRLNERLIGEVQFRQISADLDADYIGDVDVDASEVTVGFRLAL